MPGLTRRIGQQDQVFVATVPPSTTPTKIKVRGFMRRRDAGGSVPSMTIDAPEGVELRRIDFDAATDRRVSGGEG